MVSLYINGKLADLKLDVPIPYTYRFDSVDIPGAIRTGNSRTLTLPGTLNNTLIFGGIDKVQSAGFNASVKAEYMLFNNGQRINRGYLQLINILKEPLEFEVTLFDELGDFFNKLKEKKLVELPLNITHKIDSKYLSNLWSKPEVFNDVEYIPMLQGFYSGFDSNKYVRKDGTTVEFSNNYNEWEIAKFSSIKQKPALRLLSILNTFKSEYNINFTDVLSDPIIQSAYITGLSLQERTEEIKLVNTSHLKSYHSIPFSGRNIENRTLLFDKSTSSDALGVLINGLPNLDKYINKEVDIDANVAITISDVIVRSEALDLSGITEYELHPTSRPDYPRPTLRYSLKIDNQELNVLCNDYRLRYEYGRWEPIFFNATDVLEESFVKKIYPKVNNVGSEFSFLNVWDYRVWNLRTSQYEDFLVNALEVSYNVSVEVNYKAKALSEVVVAGTEVILEKIMPKDLTQFDFLVNIAKHLGLVFYSENDKITVCKRKDYYINEINNLTVIKRMAVKPLVFDKNKLIFGYKENTSNSFFKEYKDKTGNNYCDKLVNTGYEFNAEKQRYFGSTPFESPIVIDYQFGKLKANNAEFTEYSKVITNLRLPLLASFKDGNYEYSANNLQIYFKNGSIPYQYEIFDELISNNNQQYRDGLPVSVMPLFTNIKAGLSLDYGKPEVSFTSLTDTEYPEDITLFSKRFKNYIIDRYNADSRLYECEVYIPLNELLDNIGRKFYYLDNSYWVIQSIEDYDYNNPGKAKVTLLKVKDINNYII